MLAKDPWVFAMELWMLNLEKWMFTLNRVAEPEPELVRTIFI
jgi:hypothetical protein